MITSRRAPCSDEWVTRAGNEVLFPLSHHGHRAWDVRSVEQIWEALRERPELAARKKGGGKVARRERGGLKEWWWLWLMCPGAHVHAMRR